MAELRSRLIGIAAEIVRTVYRDDQDKDDRLTQLAIELRDLADAVQDQGNSLTQRTARLQKLRSFMTEVEWRDFCYDCPDAEDWFDADGVPK